MPDNVAYTPEQALAAIARLRVLATLLDDKYRIPFTRIRFGIDPVLGLIPGVGDVLSGLLSAYIVYEAARIGVPKATIVRMIANVLIDVGMGAIPILGDVADVAFKANRRNMELMELDALEARITPSPGRKRV